MSDRYKCGAGHAVSFPDDYKGTKRCPVVTLGRPCKEGLLRLGATEAARTFGPAAQVAERPKRNQSGRKPSEAT